MRGSIGRSSRWSGARLSRVSEGVVHRTDEGERHAIGSSSAATIKADAEATGGLFYVSECDVEAGYPPYFTSTVVCTTRVFGSGLAFAFSEFFSSW
jgi:hypothetical protein